MDRLEPKRVKDAKDKNKYSGINGREKRKQISIKTEGGLLDRYAGGYQRYKEEIEVTYSVN